MTSPPTQTTRVPPLDLGRVRAQCERIRAGFAGLHAWIPLRPLSGSSVARWTGLKGPLCRRVLAAVQHSGEPAELARILPGAEGLELFVSALERRGAPADLAAPARQAIGAFAELMHEGGGSQRRLVAAIREQLEDAAGTESDPSDLAEARRRLHLGARALTGTSCESQVVISLLFRSASNEGVLDSVGALGRLGYRARRGAPPLISKRYAHPEDEAAGPAEAPGGDLQRLLGTSGLTFTQSRLDDSRVLTTCEGSGGESAIDLWNGPVRDRGVVRFEPGEGAGYSSLFAVGTPTQTFVHDLWVERPLARASVLRAGVYRATPDTFAGMDYERWYDRLPGEPRILLPGDDLGAGVGAASPRHVEALEHCFEAAGVDPAQFVGYRCIVEYPVWMAVYRLTLEFDAGYEPGRSESRSN